MIAVELIDLAPASPRSQAATGVTQNHSRRTLEARITYAVVIDGKEAVPVTDPTHVATPSA